MDEYEKFLKDWEKVFQEYPSMKKELVNIIPLSAKQTAPQGLVEELSKRLKYDYTVDQLAQPQEVEDEWQEWLTNVLSRYQPAKVEEPIEKLAERKGWPLSYSVDASGILYSEKAARAFLEGLKDKEEGI